MSTLQSHLLHLDVSAPAPLPVKNPRKVKWKHRSEDVTTAIEKKNQAMTLPLSCFFAAEVPWFNLGAYWVVKPLKCIFYYLKGRGPLKKVKNLRKCRRIYGPSIDTTHTPPLFSFYTNFKCRSTKYNHFIIYSPISDKLRQKTFVE